MRLLTTLSLNGQGNETKINKISLLSLKQLLMAVFMLLCYQGVFAQGKTVADYDLPEGIEFPSTMKVVNYSYKLKGDYEATPIQKSASGEYNFFEGWTNQELTDLKNDRPETYNYYMEVKSYYDGLSDKAKSIFTPKEVLMTYVFNPNLKEKLLKL